MCNITFPSYIWEMLILKFLGMVERVVKFEIFCGTELYLLLLTERMTKKASIYYIVVDLWMVPNHLFLFRLQGHIPATGTCSCYGVCFPLKPYPLGFVTFSNTCFNSYLCHSYSVWSLIWPIYQSIAWQASITAPYLTLTPPPPHPHIHMFGNKNLIKKCWIKFGKVSVELVR